MTVSSGPTWLTVTEKPSFSRMCVARPTGSPSTLGIATVGGPAETVILMTWPWVNVLPGGCDWRMIVPAGTSLLTVTTSSETPLACDHPSAAACGWPTKSGIGGPALTTSCTGCGCGHRTPAAGGGLAAVPAAPGAGGALFSPPGGGPPGGGAPPASRRGHPGPP